MRVPKLILLEFYMEVAKFAQTHLVAAEQLFADAGHGIGQDALHGALREGTVVVCDVLTEVVKAEAFVHLCSSIGLRLGDVSLLSSGLCSHDCD